MAVLARIYTMFFFVFAVLPCLAAAAAVVPRGGGGGGSDSGQHCSSGPVQCCQTSQSADSQGAAGLLGLLGVVLQDVTALIGLSCTDVNVLGGGGGSECSAQTLCCENNHFDGLINLGCSPINIYL